MSLRATLKKIQAINRKVLAAQAVQDNAALIVNLNKIQLKNSKLSTGAAITPKYSDAYAARKGYSDPDLYLTGALYSEMDLDVQENAGKYFIISYVPYSKYLIDRYTPAIYGLSKESIEKAKPSTSNIFLKLWFKEAGIK